MERQREAKKDFLEKRPELKDGRPPSPVSYVLKTKALWPEFPEEPIADFLERNRSQIEKEKEAETVNPPQAEILESQYRAADYFYGKRENSSGLDNSENPLVDILTIIAFPVNPKEDTHSSEFQLTSEGEPVLRPLITRVPVERKAGQRTFVQEPWGKKDYRTIAKFGGNLPTVIRGLYVLGESAKHHPLILRSTIEQYVKRFPKESGSTSGMAIGLLEIIKNLNLLYDPRFHSLTEQLRDIVFEETEDYQTLKERYSYTVVENRPFWFEGEVGALERRKLNYVRGENGKVEVKRHYKMDLPLIGQWQPSSRRRADILKKLSQLTHFNSLKSVAADFSQDAAIEAIKQDRIKRADLTEELRMLEAKQLQSLRSVWKKFIEEEIAEGSLITEKEKELISDAVGLIVDYFTNDSTLSQKTKTNILRQKENEYYQINTENLAGNALFGWILSLRNPYVAEGFKRALTQSPESFESFYLLLKLMTYEVGKGSFQTKEEDFLFDTNYRQKIDQKSLFELFEKIHELAGSYIPDVKDIAKETLAQGDSKIKDLVSNDFIRSTNKRLEKLVYRRILRFLHIDKALGLTEEDKKRAKKIARRIAILGGAGLLFYLLSRGVSPLVEMYKAKKEDEARAKETQLARERVEEALREGRIAREQAHLNALESLTFEEFLRGLYQMQGIESGVASLGEETLVMLPGRVSAREQLANVVSQSAFPEDITDRIPDSINPEQDEGAGITAYGRIHHLPENFEGFDVEPVGYFPWDLNLQTSPSFSNEDVYHWYRSRDKGFFESVEIVDSIDNLSLEFSENQLAYSLNGVNSRMYAPLGYKIVRIIQEGGKPPQTGALGEVYYDYDGNGENLPARVLFVLEPFEMEPLSPKISRLAGVDLDREYWPHFYESEALELNSRLSGDPALQELHKNFIDEIVATKEKFITYPYRDYTYEQLIEDGSEIVEKYSLLFAEYTDNNRYYALGFQVDRENPNDYKTLQSIADNPGSGYFCSVASFAFRDFMNSVGIATANQPGITLYNYQGYLWGNVAHQNSVVFLPNGEVLEVDMTPPATSQTPEEDIKALAGRLVSAEDIKKAIERVNITLPQAEGSQESLPIDVDLAQEQALNMGEIMRFMNYNENIVSNAEQFQILQTIADESQSLIAERLKEDPNFLNSLQVQDEGSLEAVLPREDSEALKRIENNVQRLQENPARTSDIFLGATSGETVNENIGLLEKIIDDANRLIDRGFEDDGSLQKIVSEAERMIEGLEETGAEILERYHRDLAYRASVEGDLMRQWRAGTDFIGEREAQLQQTAAEEHERWKLEELSKRYTERAEDVDLELLQAMEEAARVKMLRLSHEIARSQFGLEPEEVDKIRDAKDDEVADIFPIGTTVADDYVDPERLVGLAQRLRRLINNTPYLNESLDKEDFERIEKLPEFADKLASIIKNETELSTKEQIEELKTTLDEIDEIQRAVVDAKEMEEAERISEESERARLESLQKSYQARMAEQLRKKDELKKELARVALRVGAGLVPLTLAYIGIRSFNHRRKKREIIERIERSLSQNKELTGIEKDIISSAVGHLSLLSYGDDFPEKASSLLNLIQNFSKERHEEGVVWLSREGTAFLAKSSQDSYARLKEVITEGKSPGSQEVKRNFPSEVVRSLENGEENPPLDFQIIYNVSQLLFNSSFLSLAKDVFSRLGIENFKSERSIKYKVTDILEVLRKKYASNDTPEEVKPLFNAVYQLLEGKQIV